MPVLARKPGALRNGAPFLVTFARARINKVSIRKERSKANKAAYALARKINFAADLEQVQLRHDPRARERYYI